MEISVLNIEEVRAALDDAPGLAFQYVGSELGRAQNRVRRKFLRERMSGPPGIRGGEWKRQYQRHVRTRVDGTTLDTLTARMRLSRFLALHETGGELTAHNKGADMLRLPIVKSRGVETRGRRLRRDAGTGYLTGLIFLRRPGKSPLLVEKIGDTIIPRFVLKGRVRIKPRLGFRQNVTANWPAEFPKLRDALGRALRVALERRVQTISAVVQKVVNL